MLRNLNDLHDYTIGAEDGSIGNVKDLYIDDQDWVVRYLVVETGGWFSSQKVLISPIAIGNADWESKLLPVSLTRQQVKNSPDFDSDKPVTRQHEMAYAGYYSYPYYWGGLGYWGAGMYPGMMLPGYGGTVTPMSEQAEAQNTRARAEAARDNHADPHLRSCAAITGYHVQASDGEIGHVSGMLIDDETWAVRYLVVDTSNWWLGHKVLVVPRWIEEVSWAAGTVAVNLTRQAVKDAPSYDQSLSPTRAEEERLHHHHGSTGYWTETEKRATEISRI